MPENTSNSVNRKRITTNNKILLCSRIIKTSEISNINTLGNDLVKMKMGIRQVVARCYEPASINSKKKFFHHLPHTIILLVTIIGILMGIESAYPDLEISNLEYTAFIAIPIL
jgi:hypothetical protein